MCNGSLVFASNIFGGVFPDRKSEGRGLYLWSVWIRSCAWGAWYDGKSRETTPFLWVAPFEAFGVIRFRSMPFCGRQRQS